jgi:hypothetical protein
MNLLAHAAGSSSESEDAMIREQFDWLLPPSDASASGASPAAAVSLVPEWSGNEAVTIPLAPASQPSLVLFKESQFPGWSAALVSASGSRQPVDILDSEYDYMLVRLESVPAGSRLEFVYRPPWSEVAAWVASAVALVLILVWLVVPSTGTRVRGAVGGALSRGRQSIETRYGSRWQDEDA